MQMDQKKQILLGGGSVSGSTYFYKETASEYSPYGDPGLETEEYTISLTSPSEGQGSYHGVWSHQYEDFSCDWGAYYRIRKVDEPFANLDGVVTYDGFPVCAMVLANGQYMFTDPSDGQFNLNVPLDQSGQITLYVFCEGFAPFRKVCTPSEAHDMYIELQRTTNEAGADLFYTFEPIKPGWRKINGTITYDSWPVCAMILANGQYVFSDQNDGSFSLEVPLDELGRISVYGFCNGLAPYKNVLVEQEIEYSGAKSSTTGDADPNLNRLKGALIATKAVEFGVQTIKKIGEYYEKGQCLGLYMERSLLEDYQRTCLQKMHEFVNAHEWCLDKCDIDLFLEKCKGELKSMLEVQSVSFALRLAGYTAAAGKLALVGQVSTLITDILLTPCAVCYLSTSWMNPSFLEAWLGYMVAEYNLYFIDLMAENCSSS